MLSNRLVNYLKQSLKVFMIQYRCTMFDNAATGRRGHGNGEDNAPYKDKILQPS